MSKSRLSSLRKENSELELQNSILRKQSDLLSRSLDNSMSQLTTGLMGQSMFGQAPITSFNPALQNNIYAPVTLMWTMLMYMYRTHGLIQTAIDMPVLDALRGGLELQSDELSADDLAELDEYLDEHGILTRIGDAFTWARLFGGGAIVVNSEADPTEPLGDEVRDGGQIELYDASRWELTCERRLPKSGQYGFYGHTLDQSRVMTIVGKRAPWILRAQLSDWGMSEVERMLEDFNLYVRNRNVIYELLQEAKVDVYTLEGFKAQLATSQGTQMTVKRVQMMNQLKDFNNALILDKNDAYEQKQVSFGGMAEIMKENRMAIASALRMPMAKLFGMGAAGFSSGEDDIENYNSLVESEVRQPMRQIIRKVLKLVVQNLFGDDLDIRFNYKPLRVLSSTEEENLKTSKQNRYLALYEKMIVDSRELGEMLRKDNLSPIPLRAERGLLDEHPVAPSEATLSGTGAPEPGGNGASDLPDAPVPPAPSDAPPEVPEPKEASQAPEVPEPKEVPGPELPPEERRP